MRLTASLGCVQGADNMRDDVDEACILSRVSLYVAEFVPTGVNSMVNLNDRLGAMDRCQVHLSLSRSL